jgi:hypothetical protein
VVASRAAFPKAISRDIGPSKMAMAMERPLGETHL